MSMVRIDPSPATTISGQSPIGGEPELFAVPAATVALYTDTSATILAATYTDATGGVPCPLTAQVTLPGSSLPQPTTGPQGQFGFWVAPGTYYYTITLVSGTRFGPFPVSASGVLSPATVSGKTTLLYYGGAWHAANPDGTPINIAGSTNGGIQEVMTAAVGVDGRGSLYIGPGTINATSGVHLPPCNSFSLDVDCDVTFTSVIATGDGVWIDSFQGGHIHWNGSIGYQGSGRAVRFNPHSPAPVNNIKNIQWGDILFANIQSYPSGGIPGAGMPLAQSNVRFVLEGDIASPLQGLIAHNSFRFLSLWGALDALDVDNAASAFYGSFQENTIDVVQAVFFTHCGIRAAPVPGTAVCTSNLWRVSVLWSRDDGTGTAAQQGIHTGEDTVGGIWDVASLSQPSNKASITFGAGTTYVQIRLPSAPGGTIVDSSGNYTNRVDTAIGTIYPQAPAVNSTQAVGASPWTAQNKTLNPIMLFLSGGTITTVGLSVDGANFINGPSGDHITLWPGMYIRITHTGAPTMIMYGPISGVVLQLT